MTHEEENHMAMLCIRIATVAEDKAGGTGDHVYLSANRVMEAVRTERPIELVVSLTDGLLVVETIRRL
jgi:hypothetical protein